MTTSTSEFGQVPHRNSAKCHEKIWVIEVDCDEVHKSLMAVLLISFLAPEKTERKRINAGWQKLTSIYFDLWCDNW